MSAFLSLGICVPLYVKICDYIKDFFKKEAYSALSRWAINPMKSVLKSVRWRWREIRQIQKKRRPCDDGGRDHIDTATK